MSNQFISILCIQYPNSKTFLKKWGMGLESIFATFLNCFCLCAFHHKECFIKKLCKQKSHWRCKGSPHYIFQSLDLYLKNKLKQTKKQKKTPTLKLTNQLPPPPDHPGDLSISTSATTWRQPVLSSTCFSCTWQIFSF